MWSREQVALANPEADVAYEKLRAAIKANRSHGTCLRHWSVFVRARDQWQCVICNSDRFISAHHICRKSFIYYASLDTGNGLTLCGACHQGVHEGYNGRPDFGLPMDAQGGEKIETMCALYGVLLGHAYERQAWCEEYYSVNVDVLRTFKRFQGFPEDTPFPGGSLAQAWLIWRQAQQHALNALLRANGLPERPVPMLPGITVREG
jgi:hypothetical protein